MLPHRLTQQVLPLVSARRVWPMTGPQLMASVQLSIPINVRMGTALTAYRVMFITKVDATVRQVRATRYVLKLINLR